MNRPGPARGRGRPRAVRTGHVAVAAAAAGLVSVPVTGSVPAGPAAVVGPGAALRTAIGDFYRNSWRFVLANSCLSAVLVGPVAAAVASTVLAPVLLVLAAGPVGAGLVHCAVLVTQRESGEVRVADFGRGVRRHWRRGLALGVLTALVAVAGAVAIRFYAGRGGMWTVAAFGCGYLLAAAALYGLVLWPVAIHRADWPLAAVARQAAAVALERWPALFPLGAALLLVNLAGAVAVLPVLTCTVAYSSLAVARLVLPAPRPDLAEA